MKKKRFTSEMPKWRQTFDIARPLGLVDLVIEKL